MEVVVFKAGNLQKELIITDKAAHRGNRLTLFLVLIVVEQFFALLQEEGQTLFLFAGYLFGVQNFICTIDISRVK